MLLPDAIQLALRAVTAQRLRSFLTLLGIAVGIASVILLTSIGEGIHRFVLAEFTQFGTSIASISPGKVKTSGPAPTGIPSSVRPLSLDDARAKRFPRLTGRGEEYPDATGALATGERPLMPHEEVLVEGERPSDNINPLPVHPEHRWGLGVDLDRCTGCGACVVACYAENNNAVVGRELISQGRVLSWLRIERHVFGEGRSRQVRFLPVMCQQCTQAPCESVCPTFAAYHTNEGLNAQVYNRCVGTRFCSNNCPYKVRRFNFFEYPREAPATEQLNPDVTVRTRGVMEKCTFCIQRIREVTNRAKAEGRRVGEGEITPACVQTCATGALSFGDYKRADGRIVAVSRDPRAYRLLDYQVNTRPGVVYLRRDYSGPVEVKG